MNPVAGKLQGITAMISQRSEVLVIFAVIGIIFMMILPMPTGLVDVLIALNISISALMVVLAMYMPGPLAFATFPALLLITTLFRMALSITTTRLILLQGDAGQIVEAFGEFVVGGNLVVGFVIFMILTIVNFMVITKGSERVAEVAARFTLDAMPGKQMSIDGDLRAGLLDARQAQQKRADVARESQLFGAMDGAMKFVKGDAVAGLIIVFVNILGGFSIGVMQLGLPAGEAIKMYSILTIGDGLVAQIPALLISITAGFIITRVSDSSKPDANVGSQMTDELTAEPKAFIVAALVMLGFAMVPGMPALAFCFFALLFGVGGVYRIFSQYKQALALAKQHMGQQVQATEVNEDDVDLRTFSPFDKLSISMRKEDLAAETSKSALRMVRRARNHIVTSKGYTIPGVELVEDESVASGEFVLSVYGVAKMWGLINPETVVVCKSDLEEKHEVFLKKMVQKHKDKAKEFPDSFWFESSIKTDLDTAETAYKESKDHLYYRTKITLLKDSPSFIGIEETQKILTWLENECQALAGELQRSMPLAKVAEILQGLARDAVSIRSVRKIAELVVENSSKERSLTKLIENIRVGLKEQICHDIAEQNTLNILILEPNAENAMRNHIRQVSGADFLELPLDQRSRLFDAIRGHIRSSSVTLSSLVVSQDLREALRNVLRNDFFDLPILSSSELSDAFDVVPVATVSM